MLTLGHGPVGLLQLDAHREGRAVGHVHHLWARNHNPRGLCWGRERRCDWALGAGRHLPTACLCLRREPRCGPPPGPLPSASRLWEGLCLQVTRAGLQRPRGPSRLLSAKWPRLSLCFEVGCDDLQQLISAPRGCVQWAAESATCGGRGRSVGVPLAGPAHLPLCCQTWACIPGVTVSCLVWAGPLC